jgi:UDP-N-acetylmuramate--alanine ligase
MLHNLAGCLEILHFLGLDEATIRSGLETFPGVKKRMEILELSDDRRVIKDYAHHPVEVDSLVSAVLEAYSDRKVHLLWEAHKFSRISYEDNYAHFLKSLARGNGDILVLPVWAAGETRDPRFSQEIIVADISKTLAAAGKNAEVYSIASDLDLAEWSKTRFMPGEVLLSVGAGGVHKLTDKAYCKSKEPKKASD